MLGKFHFYVSLQEANRCSADQEQREKRDQPPVVVSEPLECPTKNGSKNSILRVKALAIMDKHVYIYILTLYNMYCHVLTCCMYGHCIGMLHVLTCSHQQLPRCANKHTATHTHTVLNLKWFLWYLPQTLKLYWMHLHLRVSNAPSSYTTAQ